MPSASALLICFVVGMTDGDTMAARCEDGHGLKTYKVRLSEIDAPEKDQPFGSRSKRNLSNMCFKKPARLQAQGKDNYGRLLARVECDGVDANASQVAMGMNRPSAGSMISRRNCNAHHEVLILPFIAGRARVA
jgi:endonuclease YncB( thermonuclease family)